MNKICVYTCITGDYDNIREIDKKERGIDYYCFTNNDKLKSDTWNIVKIKDDTLSNLTLARKTKILGNDIVNKYEIALWIDASSHFEKPIKDFIKTYLKENDVFVGFKHGSRDNIKDECYECVKMRKETKEKVNKLLNFYKKENYHYDNGLIESTVFIKRPNDKKVIETMNLWFDMLKKYSNRDQLTFNYCIWKTKMPIHWINLKVFNNTWLSHVEHCPKKELKDCRIYFGDSSINDELYDFDADYTLPYKIVDSTYSIDTTVKKDTNIIEIELTNVYCIVYSNFKLSLPVEKLYFYNTIEYGNKNIFYNNQGIIRLEGEFKKGDKLSFSIDFEYLNEIEKFHFINNLSNDLIILSEKYNNNKIEYHRVKKECEELFKIKNSIVYKLYLKEQKIKKRINKIIKKE